MKGGWDGGLIYGPSVASYIATLPIHYSYSCTLQYAPKKVATAHGPLTTL